MYQYSVLFFFFFFQAEDGIRDRDVTGVQTCALRSAPHAVHIVLRLEETPNVFPPIIKANMTIEINGPEIYQGHGSYIILLIILMDIFC